LAGPLQDMSEKKKKRAGKRRHEEHFSKGTTLVDQQRQCISSWTLSCPTCVFRLQP
jgi:hypothetical protein